MEKAMLVHHKSLETSEHLHKWRQTRYDISFRRETLASKVGRCRCRLTPD